MAWGQTANIKGPIGIQGPPGPGMSFRGTVPTVADLPTDAVAGDAYTVEADGHMYVFDGVVWIDGGVVVGPPGPPGIDGTDGADSTVPGPPGPAGTTSWLGITDKPATFPPTLPIASSGVTGLDAAQTGQDAAIALKAPLASPIFTGNPTAPTPLTADNDTSVATTAFVKAAIAAAPGVTVSDTAPGTPVIGSLWYAPTADHLSIWLGAAWKRITADWDATPSVTIWGDTFDRADATLDASLVASGPNGGWAWVPVASTAQGQIKSNKFSGFSTGDSGGYLIDTTTAEHYAEIRVENTGSVGNFALLRALADISAYVGFRANGANIQIFRRVAGTYTSVYDVANAVVVGDVIRVKAIANNIEIRKNGSLITTVAIGATLTGTRCGMHIRQAVQDPWIDNFLCGVN